MNSEAMDMQITLGKSVLFLFVMAGITAVASVVNSPEFETIQVASPLWQ